MLAGQKMFDIGHGNRALPGVFLQVVLEEQQFVYCGGSTTVFSGQILTLISVKTEIFLGYLFIKISKSSKANPATPDWGAGRRISQHAFQWCILYSCYQFTHNKESGGQRDYFYHPKTQAEE